jgi:hypothetical protein
MGTPLDVITCAEVGEPSALHSLLPLTSVNFIDVRPKDQIVFYFAKTL